jgi:predicted secreted hydrolase
VSNVSLACGLGVLLFGALVSARGSALLSPSCNAKGAVPCIGSAVPTRDAALDGAVPAQRSQLWRMSGRLAARDGHAFSYAATFFRYAEPHGVVLIPASVSVLDESTHRIYAERRTERAGFGLADARMGALDVRVGTWRLYESQTSANVPAFTLDAKLAQAELRVRGIVSKPRFTFQSAAALQDQYSSIASTGTIAIDGHSEPVSGKSWLDHESAIATPSAGPVEQVRVALDDGREIYVEASSSAKKTLSRRSAYLVERDGTLDLLTPASYEFGGSAGWRSPSTRTFYLDGWSLHVDDKTEFLLLEPVTYDQESVAHGDGVSYWDGAVDVFDVTPGSQGLRLGSGYVLMRGFPLEHMERTKA